MANSPGVRRRGPGQARLKVEEFVDDWLLKSRGWPEHSEQFVTVYFADEPDIPFPGEYSAGGFSAARRAFEAGEIARTQVAGRGEKK